MGRAAILRLLNPVLFISAVVQILTGAMLFFNLFMVRPFVFGIAIKLHKYNGLVLAALVIIHLSLNWNWVRAQFFTKQQR